MDFIHKAAAFIMSIKVNGKKIDKIISSFDIKPRQDLDSDLRETLNVSVVQFQLKEHKRIIDYLDDINKLIAKAISQSAQLLVFPELMGTTSLSLVSFKNSVLADMKSGENKPAAYANIIDLFSDYMFDMYFHAFSEFSRRYQVYIVAGSTYVYTQGELYNRAFLFSPDGEIIGSQDKLFPSALEMQCGVRPADTIEVFNTKIGNIAILLGEDANYYEPFKIAAINGADIIAVPSTGTAEYNSFYDLSTVAARSNEVNVFTAKSCLVGEFFSGERFLGRSAIYSPLGSVKKNIGVMATAETTSKQHVVTSRLTFATLNDSKDEYNTALNPSINEKYAQSLISTY